MMVLEDILSITLEVIGTGGVVAKENANDRRIARNLSRITIRSSLPFVVSGLLDKVRNGMTSGNARKMMWEVSDGMVYTAYLRK